MKRIKLTYDDHVEIGAKLKEIRASLAQVALRIGRAAAKNSPTTKAADRAVVSVDELRSRLDSLLCAGLPFSDESWRGVYFGAGHEPKDT